MDSNGVKQYLIERLGPSKDIDKIMHKLNEAESPSLHCLDLCRTTSSHDLNRCPSFDSTEGKLEITPKLKTPGEELAELMRQYPNLAAAECKIMLEKRRFYGYK